MKKFDDFLKTLDDDTVTTMLQEVSEEKVGVTLSKNLEETLSSLIESSSIVTLRITMGLLRLYHEWLAEQN